VIKKLNLAYVEALVSSSDCGPKVDVVDSHHGTLCGQVDWLFCVESCEHQLDVCDVVFSDWKDNQCRF